MLCPSKNQPENDLVMTPVNIAKDIIEHFGHRKKILDPCCGEGSFYDNFICNEKYWCEISKNRSFYDFQGKVDCVMTNPPWSQNRNFLIKSYQVSDEVIFLLTITHVVTKARLREMKQYGFSIKEIYCVKTPPKPWPGSGFQLAAVQIVREWSGGITLSGNIGV